MVWDGSRMDWNRLTQIYGIPAPEKNHGPQQTLVLTLVPHRIGGPNRANWEQNRQVSDQEVVKHVGGGPWMVWDGSRMDWNRLRQFTAFRHPEKNHGPQQTLVLTLGFAPGPPRAKRA